MTDLILPILTVLSFGAGQDSTALLYKYIHDLKFRKQYAPGHFIVVISDTGDEHDETYKHLEEVMHLCKLHRIEIYFITSDMGFHPNNWPSLLHGYKKYNTCGSVSFRKSCTANLKIVPFYNFHDWSFLF